jgi:hypothetical protein
MMPQRNMGCAILVVIFPRENLRPGLGEGQAG